MTEDGRTTTGSDDAGSAERWDAVVVGAGPNGLVAANRLVDAGWSVLLLEAQPGVGGAVRSDRDVHPEFVHDTFSAFYPLAGVSPTITSFGLEDHGLTWRHAPAVLGHFVGDRWALLHRDREVTARSLDAFATGDGQAWLELCEEWDAVGDRLVDGLLSPFPPVRAGLGLAARLPRVGGLEMVRTLLTPALDLAHQRFSGSGAQVLLAGNAGHADIPLDAPGSGLMALMMSMMGQTVGFPVPEGGAGRLAKALLHRFTSKGGRVRTSTEVTRVLVEGGRVTGVETRDGDRHAAGAVLADVAVQHLYGRMVAPEHLPERVRRGMRRFQMDPGTVKVDWALSGPIPWRTAPEHAPGTVHVADSVEEMTRALTQVHSGAVPARPFMLTGQMTTSDPTRSPRGTESFWAYTHVPQVVSTDAGEDGLVGRWDHDENERFADRMQAEMERLAPGFGDLVAARRVLGPHEMESLDANLVGGGVGGGTAQLHQQLVFRPVPGLGRAETPVKGLYLASASAHPGGGVHGACGNNAARAALAHARVRRALPFGR